MSAVHNESTVGSAEEIGKFYYPSWMLVSFVTCMFIHHVLSPFVFRRFNRIYREFPREKRMEWDSRHPSKWGLVALSISVGYFACDLVSMPLYWEGKELYIFILHHLAALIAFQQVVHYRFCAFFGVYRLTTEMSTPFINQRWFYRTIGYMPDRRRVCSVTLMFAILFAITRNFMIVPFWLIAYRTYKSPAYATTKAIMPFLDIAFSTPPLILDVLNLYWASKTYRIGWRAGKTLWHADWRTDIRLARARLQRRLRRIRRQRLSESSDAATSTPAVVQPNQINDLSEPAETIIQADYCSSSNSSSENEYDVADRVEGEQDSTELDSPSSLPTSNPETEELSDQLITKRQQ